MREPSQSAFHMKENQDLHTHPAMLILHFLLLKKFKNTESAHLWQEGPVAPLAGQQAPACRQAPHGPRQAGQADQERRDRAARVSGGDRREGGGGGGGGGRQGMPLPPGLPGQRALGDRGAERTEKGRAGHFAAVENSCLMKNGIFL